MHRNKAVVEWVYDVEPTEWVRQTQNVDSRRAENALSSSAASVVNKQQLLGLVLFILFTGTLYTYLELPGKTDRNQQKLIAQQTTSLRELEAMVADVHHAENPSPVANQQTLLHGDLAFVPVIRKEIDLQDKEVLYQQTFIYRLHGDSWVYVLPDQVEWEDHNELETRYFHLRYRLMDANAVTKVAPMLDAMYETLRADYGLALDPAKITLQIDDQGQLSIDSLVGNPQEPLHILSPTLRKLPIQDSPTDVLATQIAGVLAHRVQYEAQTPDRIWQLWLDALYGWQVEHYSPTFTAWRQEVTQWLVASIPSQLNSGVNLADVDTLESGIVRLCDAYGVQVRISSLRTWGWQSACRSPDSLARLYAAISLPDTLDKLGIQREDGIATVAWSSTVAWREQEWIEHASIFMRESLLDYVATTYGREAIAELFAGFREYDSWETLMPAVFGISAGDFEARWHQYLLGGGCQESGGNSDCRLPEVPVQKQ